ncbi:hypothetical protein GYMLUDRAFT_244035 [Collybiopsis luxurians FD-317 M1]|uniref:Uncharacterized protein n=1 Tax=Collybiopsis luxurians FD-317 M1 TaxID=944289 RepID=A0A0D0BYJ9_9AGAR|nr:hypothetical protein GYMLUDRAFT_244035 [Collybiopsis luxurians FD-317 M1]
MASGSKLRRCRSTHLFLFYLIIIPLIAFSTYTVKASPLSTRLAPAWSDGFDSPRWKEFLKKFDIAEDEMVIGWRNLGRVRAREYQDAKALTAAPASFKSLGEGAYFGPFPGKWAEDVGRTELFLIIAKSHAAHGASMLFVEDDMAKPKRTKNQPAALKQYILENGMDPAKTILFSQHSRTLAYQGLIPPFYLTKSLSHPDQPHGENLLGIRLVNVKTMDIPTDIEDVIEKSRLPIARWDTWGIIKKWPGGLKLGKKGFEVKSPAT